MKEKNEIEVKKEEIRSQFEKHFLQILCPPYSLLTQYLYLKIARTSQPMASPTLIFFSAHSHHDFNWVVFLSLVAKKREAMFRSLSLSFTHSLSLSFSCSLFHLLSHPVPLLVQDSSCSAHWIESHLNPILFI